MLEQGRCASCECAAELFCLFVCPSRWQRCVCDWHRPLQKPCFYPPLPEVTLLPCSPLHKQPPLKYILLSQDGAPCQKSPSVSVWLQCFEQKALQRAHPAAMSHSEFLCLRSNTTLLNSKVATVIVKPTPALLSSPVEIEFPHLHNVSPEQSPNLMAPGSDTSAPLWLFAHCSTQGLTFC